MLFAVVDVGVSEAEVCAAVLSNSTHTFSSSMPQPVEQEPDAFGWPTNSSLRQSLHPSCAQIACASEKVLPTPPWSPDKQLPLELCLVASYSPRQQTTRPALSYEFANAGSLKACTRAQTI